MGPASPGSSARSADSTVALEDLAAALETKDRTPRRPAERMCQHATSVTQNEDWIVPEHGRHVAHFHPAFRFPPHEFDLFGIERCALRVTAVVPSYSSTREFTTSPRSTKSRGHWRAGIRRRVLNVRPVHVSARELEIGCNRLPSIVRVARRSSRRRRACHAGEADPRQRPRCCCAGPAAGGCSWPLPSRTRGPRRGCFRFPRNTYRKPASFINAREALAASGN